MNKLIFHYKVRGSRFEVIAKTNHLAPITYNLKPDFTRGQSG